MFDAVAVNSGWNVQRFPAEDDVARESDRVAVAARPRVAREEERALAVAGGVEEVEVVEHPERVDAGDAGVRTVLPVHPPEVDALRLHRVVQHREVRREEGGVVDLERDLLAQLGVAAEGLGHRRVGVLERAHPVGGVEVQRDLHAAAVHLGEEGLGVGEVLGLPAVAGPAAVELGRHAVDPVPVHVEHGDREPHALALEAVEQLDVGVLRCSGGSGSTSCRAPSAAAPAASRTGRTGRAAPRRSRARTRRRRDRCARPRAGSPSRRR